MKKMILYAILSIFLLTGCAALHDPIAKLSGGLTNTEIAEDWSRGAPLRDWDSNFYNVYQTIDLKKCLGKTVAELIPIFAIPELSIQGKEVLDVYGDGYVEYSHIRSEWGDRRIVFYIKNYKVYNAIKY